MAEIGDQTVLVTSGSSRIIGICRGDGKAEIACFTRTGIVSVYNVADGRCQSSVAVKLPNITLSPPVVCCAGTYWSSGHKKLYCFQLDGTVKKSYNLSHKVYSLLAMPTLDKPIVVYVNCSANWLHDAVGGAVSLLPDYSKDVTSSLLWCDVDDEKIFSLIKQASHDQQLLLSCLNTRTGSLSTASVAVQDDVVSCMLMASTTLLIVQEGGAVDRYDLTSLLSGSHDPTELTREHLTVMSSKIISAGVETTWLCEPLLVCSVGMSHYAVLTTTSLDICDGCYGTVVTSIPLDTAVTKDTAIQLLHHCDHMILVLGRKVYSWNIVLPLATSLSQVLGKGKRLGERPLLNMPPWKRARNDPGVWENLIKSSDQRLWLELEQLLQHLDDYSHTLHSALQQLASQLDNGREQLPQHVVTMVAEKCLSSKHTSHELLQFLIKNGNFPTNLCEKLVNVAMETDNLSLIDDMLTHIDHTPEHILVMLLTSLVDRLQDSNQSTLAKPLLLKVFSCSYNEVLLRHNMRKLSFQQSMILVELLHDLLSNAQWSCSNPSYQQIVEWVSLIIDSHAMQFIMSHEARQLILNVHRLTGQRLKALESLSKMQGPLELLQSRHNTSSIHHKHLYTIEWININD